MNLSERELSLDPSSLQNTIFFADTLRSDNPYISFSPRNHESLFLVTKGALLYEKGNHQEIVKKGQIGYIARGSLDKSSPCHCDEVSYIAINFNFSYDDPNPQQTLPFPTLCSAGLFFRYENLFQEALDSFQFKAPGYQTVCNGILLQLIGHLFHEMMLTEKNQQKIQKMGPALELIKSHYADPNLKISTLSESCYMSEKHFRRIFTEVYQKTPYAFLQEFRIHKAEILLQHTVQSIPSIAAECGFSDIYSFSHSFKKHTGTSPVKYRELTL